MSDSSTIDSSSFTVPSILQLPFLEILAARDIWSRCAAHSSSDIAILEADAVGLFELLTQLRASIHGYFGNDGSALGGCITSLDEVVRFITRVSLSLRSALSRHAVVAAGELASASMVLLNSLSSIDGLVHSLLLRAVSDKKFIRSEAEVALRTIASISPSSHTLLFSFLRHSNSKSRPLSVACAKLAHSTLQNMPLQDILTLNLSLTATMIACFVTSKSSDARAAASDISRILSASRGYICWTDALKASCKPAEFRGLVSGLDVSQLASTICQDFNEEDNVSLQFTSAILVPMSPGNGSSYALEAMRRATGSPAGAKIPSLAQYLRRRRSGQPRSVTKSALKSLESDNIAQRSPFSPVIVSRRLSKSPVLCLTREQQYDETRSRKVLFDEQQCGGAMLDVSETTQKVCVTAE
jgi:hypothetical protein